MAAPARTASSYGPGVAGASKAVLLELMTVLRAYRDALILIGGWVPYFLLEQHRRPDDPFVHVGSIDIDLAVDPDMVDEPHYATIAELLTARGYRPATDRRGGPLPQSFERTVQAPLTDKPYTIRVDFLAPRGPAEAGRARHLLIQDAFLARKTKGCAAAFRYATSVPLTGTLPGGGQLTVPIRMADVAASLTMKGIVLGERYREKDAYDIYALVAHYRRGPRDVAEALRPRLEDPLVNEGMAGIRTAFATRQAHGPAWAAAFLVQPLFAAERERVVTDAFMTVHEFTTLLFEPELKTVNSEP
ncbi:MAG: hypothetical protein Q8R91_10530 [Candidatus Omnitrophota bacterium]|nr:hypothetical protein [Candidatus Omnitrophota bacterium]